MNTDSLMESHEMPDRIKIVDQINCVYGNPQEAWEYIAQESKHIYSWNPHPHLYVELNLMQQLKRQGQPSCGG